MKLFLAGTASRAWLFDSLSTQAYKPYILESFYYCNNTIEQLIPCFKDFLLDSGAFTFMQGKHGGKIDWNEYVKKYADFINKNQIKHYFELDIDSIVGYENVKKLRNQLYSLTGVQPIPVWHKSRGSKDFTEMCKEYPYVAIGGIVSGEIPSTQYKYLPKLISEAHNHGARIHGLGFTSLKWLPFCHFDSVDSTAWTTGNRFGYIYQFDGETMQNVKPPKGNKLADTRLAASNNYNEWIKFQQYAETNL